MDRLLQGGTRLQREVVDLLRRTRRWLHVDVVQGEDSLLIDGDTIEIGDLCNMPPGLWGDERNAAIIRFVERRIEQNRADAALAKATWPRVRSKLRTFIFPVDTLLPRNRTMPARGFSFGAEAVIGFVHQRSMSLVANDSLAEWKITSKEAFAVSDANLDAHARSIEIETKDLAGAPVAVPSSATKNGASLILAPSFMRRLSKTVGRNGYVAIPRKDDLLAWPSDHPGHSFLIDLVRDYYETGPNHRTMEIFRIADEGIMPAFVQ